ncbi:MAG TPA: hypothetical protein GXZ48_00450 [Acholeplasmataceae bacterium]|nr:hypothetical protein [Acholeplasmataceae bacterium]
MKGNKKLIESVIFLALTVLLLITSTFAWFTFSNQADVEDLVIPIGNFEVDVNITISKNDGDPIAVSTAEDMYTIFNNAVPNDKYEFNINIKNQSNTKVLIILRMENIESVNSTLDIRNVFYIAEGNVLANGQATKLEPNSTEEEIVHGQVLNLYRLNNLTDHNNSITLYKDYPLEIDEEVNFTFTIFYDHTTEHIGYQNGMFRIKRFYIYFNTK